MKVQRICPTCSHRNIVNFNSQSAKAYFTCRCGATLPVGESEKDFQYKTSQMSAVTIRCGRCRNTFKVQSNETSAICACGTTNRISSAVNMALSIICGNCRRQFDVNRYAKSATCSCGTVLLIGQKVPNVNDSSYRNVVTNKGVETDSSSSHLGKLEIVFPRRAEDLRNHVRNGGELSGRIEDVAALIWSLSQLWLVFLDGENFGLTKDRAIYDEIVSFARANPSCLIEDEAEQWMRSVATSLSNFEIALALNCCVDSVGTILQLNGNYDDTYRMLIRGRVDPTLRK
jgi:uncharacterized CHY-type Zn-finger protein